MKKTETIQTTALLGSTRILRRVLEACSLSDANEKTSDKAGEKKKLVRSIIIKHTCTKWVQTQYKCVEGDFLGIVPESKIGLHKQTAHAQIRIRSLEFWDKNGSPNTGLFRSVGAVEYTDSFNECLRYDPKQSNGEVPLMLELWGMWSTPAIALRSTLEKN